MSMTASCTQFSVQVPAGTVLRVAAMDVHHLLDGPVTSGANVIINRYNPDGSLGEIGQISHLDDDWWSLFTMPDIQDCMNSSWKCSTTTANGMVLVIVRFVVKDCLALPRLNQPNPDTPRLAQPLLPYRATPSHALYCHPRQTPPATPSTMHLVHQIASCLAATAVPGLD